MPLIAVVDDRVTNRNILAKLASSLGEDLAVRAFEDPRSALDWAADNTPDLVITDYKMPKMDGAEFVRQFRKLPLCFDVPVVVVTVYEDRDFRYKALEAGATDFLISPVDHHEFRTRVRNLLMLRRQQEIIRKRALTLEEKLVLTNRLRIEELQESRETLSHVIDTVPAMICATNAAGNCVFVNNNKCDFFRIDAKDAIGRPIAELFGDDYAQRHRELDAQVFTTGRVQSGFEEVIPDAQGRARVFLTTKAPLRRQNDSKTEFLANTSHELRTPLNAIIGFAEMMKMELLGPIGNPRYHEYAGDILASAQHLLHIIDDLLDMSSIEAGEVKLHESVIAVPKMLKDVFRLIHGRAEEGQVRLLVSTAHKLPMLRADERKVKQVLLNLLSNGIKFTPPGGSVSIVASANDEGGLRFVVSDTGVGIAEQDIPTAKARFGRIHKSALTSHAGTGLGLSLAIELTRLHGGALNISSSIGSGTSISVDLPAERCVQHAEHV